MKTLADYTPQQLEQAIDLKKQIAALEARLASLSSGAATGKRTRLNAVRAITPAIAPKKKRQMSAAGRARIAAAARARWAKAKAKGKNRL
jgi:hypothetical protein